MTRKYIVGCCRGDGVCMKYIHGFTRPLRLRFSHAFSKKKTIFFKFGEILNPKQAFHLLEAYHNLSKVEDVNRKTLEKYTMELQDSRVFTFNWEISSFILILIQQQGSRRSIS